MTEHDSPETEAAPTAAAELAEPTTELPPATHVAEAAEAWSLDDTAEVEPPSRASRLVWSGLVALVVVLAGALVFLGTTLFSSGNSKHVAPLAVPATTIGVAAPPPPTVTVTPPATMTVTAAAPSTTVAAAAPSTTTTVAAAAPTTTSEAPAPLVFSAAKDQEFLYDMQGDLVYAVPVNPAQLIDAAHQYCRLLHQGVSTGQATQQIEATTGMRKIDVALLTARAQLDYSNCF